MDTTNFNLRGIPPEVMELLKKEAKRLHTSVNTLMLKIIERSLGFTNEKYTYHDLDHLAGSWSTSDANSFQKNTQSFEQIDEDFWK